jgi:hypothetical protein
MRLSIKKPLAVIVLAILAGHLAIAQNSTRNVGEFRGVSLGVSADLYITQGNNTSVVIEASDEVQERIETRIRDGVLIIKQDDDWKWWKNLNSKKIKIYITNPTFEHVSVSGSGDIQGENTLQSKEMYIAVSGSGKLDLDIKVVDLDSKISGSGNMNIKGSARNTTFQISGSGNMNAESLASEHCQVRISGSGNCRVQVDSSLESRVSGSGNVYYKGNPEKLSNHSSGSGSIKKIG